MVSAPTPAVEHVVAALLPVMMLASALPVPLMLALPVRVRFSTLAPSVKLIDDCTVSVPALSASVDHVAGVVDDIGVVAGAADHGVGAGAAVERVVAAVAGDDVGERIAGAVDVGAAGQGQVLDIGAERVGDRRLHRVGALVERLRHHVAGIVDDVGVVAGAADHRVGAGPAVKRVIARAAGDGIRRRHHR